MAKRGPKPRSVDVVPIAQEWDAPAALGDVGRAEFEHCVDLLRQRSALDRTDRTLVEARAKVCELLASAYAQLQKDGAFVESDRGNVLPHPAAKVLAQSTDLLRRIDNDLGLTPGSAKVARVNETTATGGYGQWAKYLTGGSSS